MCVLFAFSAAYAQSDSIFSSKVFFERDKFLLTEGSKKTLLAFTKTLQGKKVIKVVLQGYADSDGSDEHNMWLTENRTREVKEYLQKLRLAGVYELKPYGESQPIGEQLDDEGKASNRVVTIDVTIEIPDSDKPKSTLYSELALQDYLASLRTTSNIFDTAEIQTFMYKSGQPFTFRGKKGTVLKFPALYFLDDKGAAILKDSISLLVVEIKSVADMLLFGTPTVSSQKLLESGGMAFVQAYYKGQRIQRTAIGKNYKAVFTSDNQSIEEMYLFEGSEFPSNNRFIDWNTSQAGNELITSKEAGKFFDVSEGFEVTLFPTTLGWINCDKFYESKKPLFNTSIEIAENAQTFAVLNNMKMVMPAYQTPNLKGWILPNLPENTSLTIVSFEVMNGEYKVAFKDATVSNGSSVVTIQEYRPMSLQELRAELRRRFN